MFQQDSKLRSEMEKVRGFAPFDIELYDLIASVGLLAKLQPELYAGVYKSPKSLQAEALADALGCIEVSDKEELFGAAYIRTLSSELIQKVVYMISEVEDFSQLAETLVRWIAETSGKQSGEAITSSSLVELISALVADEVAGTVYDGSAGLANLATGVQHKKLILSEVNRATWSLGSKLLLLKEIVADYQCHNSLVIKGPSLQADLVVMQPPWGLRLQSQQLKDVVKKAPFVVTEKGKKIPTSAGDALWVQLALFHANDSGKVLLALPPGFFFRGGYDAKCRAYLLEHDVVEAVIALPERLNSFSSISTVLLILNKAKSKKQEGIVRFVDASRMGSGKSQCVFNADEIASIVDLVQGKLPESKNYKEVLLPEIYKNDNNLNVRHYTYEEEVLEVPSLSKELDRLEKAKKKAIEAQTKLEKLLSLTASKG